MEYVRIDYIVAAHTQVLPGCHMAADGLAGPYSHSDTMQIQAGLPELEWLEMHEYNSHATNRINEIIANNDKNNRTNNENNYLL